MEYRLPKFKNDMANQFGHNVFYNNVLIRVFYYLLEKRINTRILFLMTTYRRVLDICNALASLMLSVAGRRVGLGGFKPTHFQKRHPCDYRKSEDFFGGGWGVGLRMLGLRGKKHELCQIVLNKQ